MYNGKRQEILDENPAAMAARNIGAEIERPGDGEFGFVGVANC